MFELEIISTGSRSEGETVKAPDTLSLLRKVFETINDIVDECEISCTQQGLNFQVMDSMQTCICDIFLSKDIFTKYRCDKNRTLGLKIKDFLNLLRSLKTENQFSFKIYQHDGATNLKLEFDTASYNLSRMLTLYSLNLDKYEFPTQQYDVEVSFPCNYLTLVTKSVCLDDNIGIVAENKQLSFKQNDDRTKSVFALKDSELNNLRIEKDVSKTLAKKHMDVVAKASGLCSEMRICMGLECPVFFDFQLHNQGYVRFFIAPKVEDDQ